jgi:hypothetical protein
LPRGSKEDITTKIGFGLWKQKHFKISY